MGKSSKQTAAAVAGLAREIYKREPFRSSAEEAFLNVARTASVLAGDFERLFKPHGLSGATYNALRILRGAGESGRRCTEIGEHLVAAVPDVTRLIDRLERAGLAKRVRGGGGGGSGGSGGGGGGGADRRVVMVRITPSGLALLKKLDQPVADLHQRQMGHMADSKLEALSRLLCEVRDGAPDRSGKV